MTFVHRNTELSKLVLTSILEAADLVTREAVISKAREQRGRLEGWLSGHDTTTIHAAASSLQGLLLLEDLAGADGPVLARVLSGPVTVPQPISPRPLKWLLAAVLVGLIGGLGIWTSFVFPLLSIRDYPTVS